MVVVVAVVVGRIVDVDVAVAVAVAVDVEGVIVDVSYSLSRSRQLLGQGLGVVLGRRHCASWIMSGRMFVVES